MELKLYPAAHRYYMQNDTFCDETFTAYSFKDEETGEEIYFRTDEVKRVSKNKGENYAIYGTRACYSGNNDYNYS